MSSVVATNSFSDIRKTRLEILADTQEQLEALGREEAKLAKRLIEAAPRNLRSFLKKDVIQKLFRVGTSYSTIYYGLGAKKAFYNFANVKKIFTDLETAWNGAVRVSFGQFSGFVKVTITAT